MKKPPLNWESPLQAWDQVVTMIDGTRAAESPQIATGNMVQCLPVTFVRPDSDEELRTHVSRLQNALFKKLRKKQAGDLQVLQSGLSLMTSPMVSGGNVRDSEQPEGGANPGDRTVMLMLADAAKTGRTFVHETSLGEQPWALSTG